ncbi:MAG TPA: serine/threonine-protein kinase, partial [Polyangia bacterium]|nr:serine/threonine-protein kinase [Polyangia bacterium]
MEDSADAAPLVPGQVLENKYRISKMLGGGAMGIVYEGYHLRLEKSVAIKVLRPELAKVEDLRDRFEAEARAAAALGHPNIVTVTDLGQTPTGALYFVMDRLRGETLGERLEKNGKLDVAAAARIMLEVLSGLEAAHKLRLVHRDLKPDNIFLARPPGGREIAKILDFGIAKALASVGRRAQGTRVGTTVGTPMYMAPEQAVADPDIDARADLYSLGVILYQTLAGRPPFDGNNAVDVLAAVMMETPPALGSLCPQAPFELVQLVEAAMSRDRNKRPSTAGEFITRLQEAVAQVKPVAAAKGNTAYDASGLASLDKAVLVDLTGNPVHEAAPAAITFVDDLFQQ